MDQLTLHRRAATKLMGLSESQRLSVEKTLLELTRFPLKRLPLRRLKGPSGVVFSLGSGIDLRLLFVKQGDKLNILDIVHASELPLAA